MTKRSTLIIFLLFCAQTFAVPFQGPISKSLGGGGRAGLQSLESGLLNPALVPLIQASDMSAYYQDGYSAAGIHETAYGLGVIDASKEAYFPAAAHYIRLRNTGLTPTAADGELWHAAAGKKFGEWLVTGVSVYRLSYNVEGDREYTQWNYSLGLLALVNEGFGVAYVLENIAKPGSRVPTGLRQELTQGLGAYGSVAGLVKVRADIAEQERNNPDHKLVYSASVESMTSQWILFRLGFRRDELQDRRVWTTGFAFNGPRLKLDYAFEKNVEGTSGAVHSVDLRVPF